jgi:4-hydroxyacetophenone monooxygenase
MLEPDVALSYRELTAQASDAKAINACTSGPAKRKNARRRVVDHPGREISASELDQKVAKASISALVVCLAQITGDPRWLDERYGPARTRGLADDPDRRPPGTGPGRGHRAVRDAVLEWVAADRPSLPVPSPEQMPAFMEQALGEEAPARYSKMMLAHLGFARRTADPRRAALG